MLKRLIEVALPLKEVSEQSAREKSIRHGHISTLHIWWARRPLAACRAAVFASLIPDPDDPECPENFRKLVMELLSKELFRPHGEGNGKPVEDTPRNRCLEFIKHLVRWENSNNPDYVEPARKLIAAAHKFLHPGATNDAPKVLDPFAGGGAIPLEALRLGCEAHAIDLNPVAHLIELCTLVYPQKYGQPDSRPVPDYVKRLIAHNRNKKNLKAGSTLFEEEGDGVAVFEDGDVIPDVDMTEAEYRKNPLAADVKYWGHWVLKHASKSIAEFYPSDSVGNVPAAYIWARTVTCPNPACKATIPLIGHFWLCNSPKRKVALHIRPNADTKECDFDVVQDTCITFDASNGTILQGRAKCPFCDTVVNGDDLRKESKVGRMGQQLLAVITTNKSASGKIYRKAMEQDRETFQRASSSLEELKAGRGANIVPGEPISPDRPSPNARGLSGVVRYGIDDFGKLFNARQLLTLTTFAESIKEAIRRLDRSDDAFAIAVGSYLALQLNRIADYCSAHCIWHTPKELVAHTFGRQSLQMVWDYVEVNPIGESSGDFKGALEWIGRVCDHLANTSPKAAHVTQGTATSLPFQHLEFDAVVTDPPYYDSVPYADLSDFFYVWSKRVLGSAHPTLFRTPLTPKRQELIAYFGTGDRQIQKPPQWYEAGMADAFREMSRVMVSDGIACVLFAHRTTTAWEAIIQALLRAGHAVSASWPLHTEMKTRMVARNAAALASSVTLVCRKRPIGAGNGLWDDVRKELRQVANERLEFFWSQGIRGADFFISAIGPALSVFGKYEKVTKLSGEEVTVGQFLDEVRSLVTNYALAKILKTSHTGTIDPESRFYVVWKWSYIDTKVPADESFKLAQALGIDTEIMWDRTGVLEKSGENVQSVPVAKRMKIKDLGEPSADGSLASLIDVLHRLCVFRDKGDTDGMAEFLGRSGQGNNPSLWLVAQAISEILPDGEKEKQLMQGLLNQKEQLEQAAQGRLF